MMGVSSAPAEAGAAARLSVTDDDVIEKSNLSRQFLFRNHDVGQSKSLSAVRAACRMNPELLAVALLSGCVSLLTDCGGLLRPSKRE